MKEKIEIIMGIVIGAIVLVTLSFFVLNAGNLELNEIAPIAIAIILVASAFFIIWDRLKNIKKGLPAKDERLVLINYKAGYYGFIAAIWSSVFFPLTIDILFNYELPGHLVTAVVVIVSGLAFIASYLYLARKG